jgi:hypothetical protein
MKINSKAPTGFILDISLLQHTVDSEEVISPLVWQYVIEQDMINQLGLNVIPTVELYPSLIKQVGLVVFLQHHLKFSIVNCIPGHLVLYLRSFEVEAKINGTTLFIVKK